MAIYISVNSVYSKEVTETNLEIMTIAFIATLFVLSVPALIYSVKEFYETLLSKERAEGERRGRESAIQELFEIERDKWSDAIHCTCMGYALVELSGGEESEGGKQMEKRLRTLPTDSTEKCCKKCYTSDYVEGQIVAIGCLNPFCRCHPTTTDSTEV